MGSRAKSLLQGKVKDLNGKEFQLEGFLGGGNILKDPTFVPLHSVAENVTPMPPNMVF